MRGSGAWREKNENSNRNIGLTALSHHDTVLRHDPGAVPAAHCYVSEAVCARLEARCSPCYCRRQAGAVSDAPSTGILEPHRPIDRDFAQSFSRSSRLLSICVVGYHSSISGGRFAAPSKQSAQFLDVFRRSNKFSEVQAVCRSLGDSPLVGLFQAGYAELTAQLRQTDARCGDTGRPIRGAAAGRPTLKSLTAVDRALLRASAVEVNKLETPHAVSAPRSPAWRRSSACSARCGAS